MLSFLFDSIDWLTDLRVSEHVSQIERNPQRTRSYCGLNYRWEREKWEDSDAWGRVYWDSVKLG